MVRCDKLQTVVAAMHLEDPDDDDLVFYILLRAVDRFYSEYSKYPGCYGDSMEPDIPKLKVLSQVLVRNLNHKIC